MVVRLVGEWAGWWVVAMVGLTVGMMVGYLAVVRAGNLAVQLAVATVGTMDERTVVLWAASLVVVMVEQKVARSEIVMAVRTVVNSVEKTVDE